MMKFRITFIVLFLLTIVEWASVSVFGPLIIDITHSLSLTVSVVGITHSFFLLFSGILSFLWSYLENFYPRKQLLVVSLCFYSCGLFITCISSDLIPFFLSRMISAIGFGALLPLTNSIIVDLSPSENRTNSFALLGMALFLGTGAGIILSGLFLGVISWRLLVFILFLVSIISAFLFISIPIPQRGNVENDNIYRLGLAELKDFLKTTTNIHLILLFFIHDFVIGTITFYFVTLLRADAGFTPFSAMITQITVFIPQLFGVSLWGKKADSAYQKRTNGKIITLLFTILIGSGFSITAYAISPVYIPLFIGLLMVYSFMTSSTLSITYSILGDINLPEVRSVAFSLGNLSGLIGRSVGIAMCGFLYRRFVNSYSQIFLLWQFILVGGIIITLIRPLNHVSIDLKNITWMLDQRVKNQSAYKSLKESKPSLKDPLTMVLDNQMVLATQQKKLAKNQFYLSKMLYYSLEVIRRVLLSINKEDEESNGFSLTEVVNKIESYIKTSIQSF